VQHKLIRRFYADDPVPSHLVLGEQSGVGGAR
jgi:hypothetical protein